MKEKSTVNWLIIATVFSILFFVFVVFVANRLLKNLPSISALEEYTPSLITKVYDFRGELITELFVERRTLVPIDEIPENVKKSFLAIEDTDFYKHHGISNKGILRAAINNIVRRKVAQGGSTITQQLAKAIFLTPERTFERKARELIITYQLEFGYSKDEILQLYLNQIYLGSGAYGVQAAAKVYFSKELSDLTLAECAMLAGLPRAPNYYSPFANPSRAIIRRATVLKRMRELGYISKEEELHANEEPLTAQRGEKIPALASYFIEYIRLQLEPKYGTDVIYKGGLSIYTTLDLNAQKAAENAMESTLANFDAEKQQYLLKIASQTIRANELDKFFVNGSSVPPKVQGALVALDPKTGGIRALIGGRDFRASQFNRAIQAKRQPGSSFKAFIYTAALENGFTPVSMIEDTPVVYTYDGLKWNLSARTTDYLLELPKEDVADPLKVWAPQNYGKKHYGKVLLRTAVEHSINTCAISVLDTIGPKRAVEYASRMGVKSPLLPSLSLALGSNEVPLIEMVTAFGVFANSGIKTEPYAIVRVEDPDGRILEENLPVETEVLSPQVCYVMTNILQGVIKRGTGTGARWIKRPCAGKTGTSNNFSDAWFIGYTPQLVAGVWVGYDEMVPLGDKMTGGRISCPIWAKFIFDTLKNEPVLNFPVPKDIVFSLINPKTGLLAMSSTPGAYLESFIKGTEPTDYYPKDEASQVLVETETVQDDAGF